METTTTTTTTTTKTFFEAVNTLIACDIARADNFKIKYLKASGKYGHGCFSFTGEDEDGPYNDEYAFNFQPGMRCMDVHIYDNIKQETITTKENMERIYGDLNVAEDLKNFKDWEIFRDFIWQ